MTFRSSALTTLATTILLGCGAATENSALLDRPAAADAPTTREDQAINLFTADEAAQQAVRNNFLASQPHKANFRVPTLSRLCGFTGCDYELLVIYTLTSTRSNALSTSIMARVRLPHIGEPSVKVVTPKDVHQGLPTKILTSGDALSNTKLDNLAKTDLGVRAFMQAKGGEITNLIRIATNGVCGVAGCDTNYLYIINYIAGHPTNSFSSVMLTVDVPAIGNGITTQLVSFEPLTHIFAQEAE